MVQKPARLAHLWDERQNDVIQSMPSTLQLLVGNGDQVTAKEKLHKKVTLIFLLQHLKLCYLLM